MKNLRGSILAVSLTLFVCCATTHSAILWSQLPTYENNSDITNFAGANDFVLAAPATLTGLRVWLSDRAQSGVLDGVADNFSGTLGWAIYDHAIQSPGPNRLFSGSDFSPVVTSTGTLDAGGREVFVVDAVFSGNPALPGGVTYWLALRDGAWGSVSDDSVMGWTYHQPAVNNPRVYNTNEANPSIVWTTGLTDNAFELFDYVIPEPASWIALALGLTVLSRRR